MRGPRVFATLLFAFALTPSTDLGQVPTPESVLGYPVGSDVERYREIAQQLACELETGGDDGEVAAILDNASLYTASVATPIPVNDDFRAVP